MKDMHLMQSLASEHHLPPIDPMNYDEYCEQSGNALHSLATYLQPRQSLPHAT